MACGCKERGAAIVAGALAIAQGDLAAAGSQGKVIVETAARDLSELRRQAVTRLGLRRR